MLLWVGWVTLRQTEAHRHLTPPGLALCLPDLSSGQSCPGFPWSTASARLPFVRSPLWGQDWAQQGAGVVGG